MSQIEIIELENHGDHRGKLFSLGYQELDFLSSIKNIHYGTIDCDSIRGNHYHLERNEILVITYSDDWTLYWSDKDNQQPTLRNFTGNGSVLIKIDPGIAHAVKNTGKGLLQIISLSDTAFDKRAPDTYIKVLTD
jgi:dTDP-4-dehydrorhamnose 3,5-epimerase-like enzyme